MAFKTLENIILGIGLVILGFLSFWFLPLVYGYSYQFSPGLYYIPPDVFANMVASGTLIGVGVVFVVYAIVKDRVVGD